MSDNVIESVDSPYIIAATSGNFSELVLENSHSGPVLVNFWSKKAGPSLRLYPVLDQVVRHYAGRVLLINLDADTEVIVTKEYGIASVPTLKLFRDGKVVETMHGFQSAEDLKKVLEEYVARDSDQTLADAIHLYTQNKASAAYEMIANAIVDDPVNPRLPLAVCKLLKHEKRYEEALSVIGSLPENISTNKEILQLKDLLSFYVDLDVELDLPGLIAQVDSDAEDLSAQRQLTNRYVIEQQYDKALDQLVNMMEIDRSFDDNYAQKAMLKIFNILGNEHALIAQYRPYLKRYCH